jgi:O-antigen/teichoic acid export membrane protein
LNREGSYKQIFKATSVFGGVQVFTILIGIIRVKAIAVFLGSSGVGLMGLLNTTVTLIHSISGLGISNSSVKFISENKNELNRKITIRVVRRLVLVTSSISMFFTILFAKKISYLVFGNYYNENIYSIIIIGTAILFYGLENGELSILQGQRKISILAKARIFSSILALIFTLPIYYFFGLKGVPYSILLIYIINCLVVFYFSDYFSQIFIKVNFKDLLKQSKGIVALGLAMAFSAVLHLITTFIVKWYISNYGSLEELGYYEAGSTLVNSYVGLVFAAMAKDYYPRLSLVNNNNSKLQEISNHQIEIGMFVILPIVVLVTACCTFILKTLYSVEFIVVKNYLYWAILGVVFKLISWSLSYIVLAKGKGKIFLIYEIIGNLLFLFLSIFGYKYYGIEGLGIVFLVYNITYFILLVCVNLIIFKIKLEINTLKILFTFVVTSFIVVLMNVNLNLNIELVLFNIISILAVFVYSGICLDNRIGFINSIKNKFNK